MGAVPPSVALFCATFLKPEMLHIHRHIVGLRSFRPVVIAQKREGDWPVDRIEIVKRSDHAKGFVVLPRRWVVERTFAWLGRCRRLAKDWENLNRRALAFLRLASIRLMLRKLCNPV